ncbi:hypothetical protein HaLaN_20745, partial [Haematococcus lacustris]
MRWRCTMLGQTWNPRARWKACQAQSYIETPPAPCLHYAWATAMPLLVVVPRQCCTLTDLTLAMQSGH